MKEFVGPIASILGMITGNTRNDEIAQQNYALQLQAYNDQILRQRKIDEEQEPFRRIARFMAGAPKRGEEKEYQEWAMRRALLDPASFAGILQTLSDRAKMGKAAAEAPWLIPQGRDFGMGGALTRGAIDSLASVGGRGFDPRIAAMMAQSQMQNQVGAPPMMPFSQQYGQMPSMGYLFGNALQGMFPSRNNNLGMQYRTFADY